MDRARHPTRGEVLVSRLRSGEPGSDELRCTGCDARISYVSAHPRGNHYVHAFLRLKPGEVHSDDCSNSVPNQIQEIVRASREGTGEEVFDQDGAKLVYRLHVLTDRYFRARDAFIEERRAPNDAARVERSRSRRRELDPYIRTAAALAVLYVRVEGGSEPELRNSAVFRIRGKNVPWKHFVFDESTYHILVERLRDDRISYPVAIIVNPQTVEITEGKQRFTSRTVSADDTKISVTAFLEDDGEIFRRHDIRAGIPYVVIARPKLTERRDRMFVGLQVFYAGQIAQVLDANPIVERDDN